MKLSELLWYFTSSSRRQALAGSDGLGVAAPLQALPRRSAPTAEPGETSGVRAVHHCSFVGSPRSSAAALRGVSRPPSPASSLHAEHGGGDPDRSFPPTSDMLAATNRPLRPYLPEPKVFKCPADRGGDITPHWPRAVESVFDVGGNSYRYNANPWCQIKPPNRLADPVKGLAEKPETWILEPSRHVLQHCLAALPWQTPENRAFLHVWHFPSGPVTTSDLQNLSKKTVAPVLFVDGHVQSFNLKEHFRRNSRYYAEPTPAGIWYKPLGQ